MRRLLRGRPQQRDLDGAACRIVRRRRHPSLLPAAESPDAPGHPVGHSGHGRAEPVRAVQDDGLALVAVVEQVEEAADEARVAPGAGEVGPPVGEEPRVGAAEGLDGDVGVADEDDPRPPGTGHDAKQPGRGGGQLLGLVDDDETDALVEAVEGRRVVVEQLGGGRQHPGGVVGPVPGERGDLVVLPQHVRRRGPLGPVVLDGEPRQVVGPLPELDRPHEQVAQLVAEAAGRQGLPELVGPLRPRHLSGGVPGEQVTQDDVLLRAVEQARRWVAAQGRLGAQHAEAERLPGARERLRRRAAQARGDLLAQRGSSAAARGQDEARVGAQPLLPDGVDDELDREGRLAGPGPAEDAEHPCRRVEGGLLAVVEPHPRRGEGRSATEDDHRRIPSRPTDTALEARAYAVCPVTAHRPVLPDRDSGPVRTGRSQAEHHWRAREVTGDQRRQRCGEVRGENRSVPSYSAMSACRHHRIPLMCSAARSSSDSAPRGSKRVVRTRK